MIYQDYRFVTKSDLLQLGIEKMIGSPYLRFFFSSLDIHPIFRSWNLDLFFLRAYMHGYFIDVRLYNRVRALANPSEYEDYRKQKIREKLEEKSASRITLTRVR